MMATERIPRSRLRQLALAMSRPGIYEAKVAYDWDRPDGVAREVITLLDRIVELEEVLRRIAEHVNDPSMDDSEARIFIAGALDDRVARPPEEAP